MSDRGMKKWNAYKSLPEHDPVIRKTMEEKFKCPRPYVSSDEAELINDILVNYQGEMVSIGYYRNNEINEITTTIKKIDPIYKELILPDRSIIKLSEVISMKKR